MMKFLFPEAFGWAKGESAGRQVGRSAQALQGSTLDEKPHPPDDAVTPCAACFALASTIVPRAHRRQPLAIARPLFRFFP